MKSYFTYGASASDRDLVTSTVNYSGVLKRYFSSLDAEVFIGGERILDINRIDFTYEEKKLPLYGFNSFIPSKVIVGQKIIQGTFVINFTEVGYLAKLIERVKESKLASEYDKVGKSCSTENAALFKKSFDILIGYGGHDVPNEISYNETYQLLEGVYITGYQQILDTSGEPIFEVYSFLAKNLNYKNAYPESSVSTGQEILPGSDSIKEDEEEIIEERYILVNIEEDNDLNDTKIGMTINQVRMDADTCKIKMTFPQVEEQAIPVTISSVKVTISDLLIDMSKTFELKKRDKEWNIKLTREETNKINKRIDSAQKGVDCLVEVTIIKSDNTEETLMKNTKITRLA